MRRASFVLAFLAAFGAPAFADSDQDRARAALARGEIKPLELVLAAAKEAVPGDVVSVELDRKKNRWTYELKILATGGKRREIRLDAETLAVLKTDDDD